MGEDTGRVRERPALAQEHWTGHVAGVVNRNQPRPPADGGMWWQAGHDSVRSGAGHNGPRAAHKGRPPRAQWHPGDAQNLVRRDGAGAHTRPCHPNTKANGIEHRQPSFPTRPGITLYRPPRGVQHPHGSLWSVLAVACCRPPPPRLPDGDAARAGPLVRHEGRRGACSSCTQHSDALSAAGQAPEAPSLCWTGEAGPH